jgi:hypothetical protein
MMMNTLLDVVFADEDIVKDTTNDGIAFLSHLELDRRIMHTFQLMATEEKPVLKIRMKTVQDYEILH